MIRTNLSTRPFYNVRAVRTAIGAAVLLVAALTAFNVVELVRLSASQRTLGAQAEEAEAEAARLRAEAAQILGRIDQAELEEVAAAASEANAIIDQRTFSWTELLTHFETALPLDVRITAVQQRPRSNVVSIGAQAQAIDDLDEFIEALEASGAFRNVLAVTEVTDENGLINAVIEGTYAPPARQSAGAP